MYSVYFFICFFHYSLGFNGFIPDLRHMNYSQTYSLQINKSKEYILVFTGEYRKLPPRIAISSNNAKFSQPLIVTARLETEIISWKLPLNIEGSTGTKIFSNTSRTLCHDVVTTNGLTVVKNYSYPVVTVSTISETNVSFEVKVDYQHDFIVEADKLYNFTISPSQPRYYFYNFSTNETSSNYWNYHTILLKVSSNDSVCMTVSIQNVSCPVFDLNEDITFRGFYETVDIKGGITITKSKFPLGFYVVFVAKADDADCSGEFTKSTDTQRLKSITLIIKPSITYDDYLFAVIVTLSCVGAFYVIFGLSFFFCTVRGYVPREMEYVTNDNTPMTEGNEITDGTSLDDYDRLSEASRDRELRLCKSAVYLNDLARKDILILKQRSYLYLYNVLTNAVFYGLPVVQLVVTYQKMLNETGEQDLCYYNFLCAHPLGVISDFNHVFSNVGYVMLGILFLWITYRREITHKDIDFDRNYGIPQHYGLFYAMGVALIMEGVLSGSYHVCPNGANFQFDSSFMYVMAVLCMVKLYQNRHPDINASAYSTFGVLAGAILLGMIGIFENNIYFWVFFTVVYLIAVLFISAQFYYMGCWKIDRGVFLRVYRTLSVDIRSGILNVIIPTYKARMCLLIIVNLWNFGLASWGIYNQHKGFAFFLLGILLSNTVLYFFFYVIMKYLHKERVNKLTLFFLCCATLCAVSAMSFFVHKSISWMNTPAQSRHFNQECQLLKFYDFHDIWHFLSAIGMFFTFMVLLTLDDDLSHIHRSQIAVF